MDVWLASNSPRRYALLQPMFPNLHHQGLHDVDETPPTGTVDHQVLTICERKASSVPDSHHDLVIVADTMLSDPDDHSLSMGKPGCGSCGDHAPPIERPVASGLDRHRRSLERHVAFVVRAGGRFDR